MSVNISGRHLLSGHLSDHIREVLERTGIEPRRLGIEITETVLLTDLVDAAAELDAVRGVGVSIDDFGTGYTSLAHLQQLPIDHIKIDRSFINQVNVGRGRSLVRMVTDLGHAIDLKIVAEGVETEEQLRILKALGADYLQGFLFSRPLDPSPCRREPASTRAPVVSAFQSCRGGPRISMPCSWLRRRRSPSCASVRRSDGGGSDSARAGSPTA